MVRPVRSACPDPAALDAFVSGQLDAARRPALEAHLDTCPACAQVVATMVELFGASQPSLGYAQTVAGTPREPAVAPTRLGRYQLGARVGEGGMGVVFEAHDPELDRRVAVKLLHPERFGDLEAQRARMMREAQAMAKLSHPNVVTVFDVGRVGAQLFLAMELVAGTTLARWLAGGPRSRAARIAMFVQAGRGLAAAHAVGLVHRDFKPDNVLVGVDGRARVTDFGLARPLAIDERANLAAARHLPVAATAAGAIVGTPAYMAPEQLRSEPADARSDQFAFCVALYEAVVGARPFEGAELRALAENVLAGRMRALPAAIPRWLRNLLARGLALDPAARFPSMDALLDELGRDHARGRRIAVTLGAMTLGVAAIVSLLSVATRAPATPPPPAARPCDALRIEVRDHWNPARKQSTAQAITAATRYWAHDLAPRVNARLDAWADAWATERQAACIAGQRRAPDDELAQRRLACLDDALGALDAMVAELDHIDGLALQRVLPAIEALPAPAACASDAALLRRPARPSDPIARAKVAALDAALAVAQARLAIGHAAIARTDLERLVSEATPAADPATLARALWLTGESALATGDATAALEPLRRAAELAKIGRADDVLLDAAIALVTAYGTRLDRAADATPWLAIAVDQSRYAGVDPRVGARLDAVVGAWHLRDRHLVDARAALLRAIATRKQHDERDPLVASALVQLAAVDRARHDPAAALDSLRIALAIVEERYGTEHPLAAQHRALIIDALVAHGDLEDAYHRAWKLAGNMLGWDFGQAEYADGLATIGRAMHASGKLDEADKFLARAHKARVREHAPDAALSLRDLAALRLTQGRPADAVAAAREAISWLAPLVEADDPRLAEAHAVLGGVLAEAGDRAAISEHRAAIALYAHRFDDDDAVQAAPRWALGRALLANRDYVAAFEVLDSATMGLHASVGFEHPDSARLCVDRADAARGLGDRTRAAELYGVAADLFERAFGADDPETRAARAAKISVARAATKP